MKHGNIYSLSTGLVSVSGKDPVNCDQAEIIGALVQKSFDDSKFTEIKSRKNTYWFHSPFQLTSLIYAKKFEFENPAIMENKQCKQIEQYSL